MNFAAVVVIFGGAVQVFLNSSGVYIALPNTHGYDWFDYAFSFW